MKEERARLVQYVMSGENSSAHAKILRFGLAVAEPVYTAAMEVRNWMFDLGMRKAHRLGRPVISIGNITTGGTGKTPVVRWAAQRLRTMGRRPAILSRGYKSHGSGLGDELTMLERALNSDSESRIFLAANPDRVAGAQGVLREHPEIDVFVLDDAFQHRRVARDLNVVLISAANPFGFGHILPRGLLREPLSGMRRADLFIITHADQASADDLAMIERTIQHHHAQPMILRAIHAQTGLLTPETEFSMDELNGKKFFLFAGIANPASFERQLRAYGQPVGCRWYSDHHDYDRNEIRSLREQAKTAGADLLLTTEKDWVKIADCYSTDENLPPIWRVSMELRFLGRDEELFVSKLKAVLS